MRLALAILAAFLIIAAGCTAPPAQQQGGAQGTPAGGASGGGAGSASGGGAAAGTGSGGPTGSGAGVTNVDECVVDCNVLTDSGMALLCKSGCYMDAAEQTKDPSKCDPIGGMGQNMSLYYATCLGTAAGVMQDATPCNRLTNSTDKDMCIVIAADKYKNPAICEGVSNSIYKSICLDDTNTSASD